MTVRRRIHVRPWTVRIICLGAVAGFLLSSSPLASTAQYVQQASAGAGVRVCLIDTGVPESTPGVVERLTATDSLDVTDPHGAQMAAIMRIAYPGVQIVSIQKVDGRPTDTTVADVINLCVSRSVSVISMSFSLTENGFDRAALQAAVDRARAVGVVLIAAAGNEGRVDAPANLTGVIGVGAVGDGGRTCDFSASGGGLVMALGCDVDNAPTDGTSDAAAYVAGTTAATVATQGLSGAALEGAVRADTRVAASRPSTAVPATTAKAQVTATPAPKAATAAKNRPYLWVLRRSGNRLRVALRGARTNAPDVRIGGHPVTRRGGVIRSPGRRLIIVVRCARRSALLLRASRPAAQSGRAVRLPRCS